MENFQRQLSIIQKILQDVLEVSNTDVALALDSSLSLTLSTMVGQRFLKSHHVKDILLIDRNSSDAHLQTDCPRIYYFLRSDPFLVQLMCRQVSNYQSRLAERGNSSPSYSLYLIPAQNTECSNVVENEGMWGIIGIYDLPLDIMPLEDDVAILPLTNAFSGLYYLHDSENLCNIIAQSIINLQCTYGRIQNITGKGKYSSKINEILISLNKKVNWVDTGPSLGLAGQLISVLILLDRNIDMVTPMLTSLTYEGLIDEHCEINSGFVELEESIFRPQTRKTQEIQKGNSDEPSKKKLKFPLNSKDPLFTAIRDKPFGDVCVLLTELAKKLKSDVGRLDSKLSTTQLRQFVDQLPLYLSQKTSATTHVNIATMITNFIEVHSEFSLILKLEGQLIDSAERSFDINDIIDEFICRRIPLNKVLRLLILYSWVEGGLKPKLLDSFRETVCKSYGYQYCTLLLALEKAGLLYSYNGERNWRNLCKVFHLIVNTSTSFSEEYNDISFVFSYSNYAPLMLRIISSYLTNMSWEEVDKYISLTQFPSFPFSNSDDTKTNINTSSLRVKGKFSSLLSSPHSSHSSNNNSSITHINQLHTESTDVRSNSFVENNNSFTKTIAIFFIGGITFAEIATLRWLQKKLNVKFLMIATNMCNGNIIIDDIKKMLIG